MKYANNEDWLETRVVHGYARNSFDFPARSTEVNGFVEWVKKRILREQNCRNSRESIIWWRLQAGFRVQNVGDGYMFGKTSTFKLAPNSSKISCGLA